MKLQTMPASLLLGCFCVSAASASTEFDLDFSVYSDTATSVGTLAPDSFGDKDGGKSFDDDSYIKNNTYAYTFTFSDGDLSTTVEGGVYRPKDNDGTGQSYETFQGGEEGVYVGRFGGGLGVGWEINPGDLDDDYHTTDNRRGQDFLVLDFNTNVEIKELEFDFFGSRLDKWRSDYSFYSDDYVDIEVFTRVFENDSFEDTYVGTYRIDDQKEEIEFDEPIEGQTFVISTSDSGEWIKIRGKWYKEKFEYFKLSGVNGHFYDPPPGGGGGGGGGPVIPTPSAALLGAGMLGLLGLRRRHSK